MSTTEENDSLIYSDEDTLTSDEEYDPDKVTNAVLINNTKGGRKRNTVTDNGTVVQKRRKLARLNRNIVPSMVTLSHPLVSLDILAKKERVSMEMAETELTRSISNRDENNLNMFKREIITIISSYLSLVRIQCTLKSYNTNSIIYPKEMVHKMLAIIRQIPREEMSLEKYKTVCRDALFLYYNIITRMAGPKHSKRLRTPNWQFHFCSVLAMLVNNIAVASDLNVSGKITSLVQFASAIRNPAYQLAVHDISSVYNSSYSVYRALNLTKTQLINTNLVLAVLSAQNTPLNDRKPRTLAQSAFLTQNPGIINRMRASGLIQDESSLYAASKGVAAQLWASGITNQSLDDARNFLCGSYLEEGVTLKCFGTGQRDLKTVAVSLLATEKLRRAVRATPSY